MPGRRNSLSTSPLSFFHSRSQVRYWYATETAPEMPMSGEVHLDLVEVTVTCAPGPVQGRNVAVAILQKDTKTGIVQRGLRRAVAAVNELERLALDLGPHRRLEKSRSHWYTSRFSETLRRSPHLEVLAVLVVSHPDVVAVAAERLGRAHHDRLPHLVAFALPVGAPIVHEVVREAPFRGSPERVAVVAERLGVVVTVQGRVVYSADPTRPSLGCSPMCTNKRKHRRSRGDPKREPEHRSRKARGTTSPFADWVASRHVPPTTNVLTFPQAAGNWLIFRPVALSRFDPTCQGRKMCLSPCGRTFPSETSEYSVQPRASILASSVAKPSPRNAV